MEPSPIISGQWPAEFLQNELTRLNREFLRDSPNPILRGRSSWPNQQLERFSEEFEEASSFGVKPISPEEPEFAELLASGSRFNWAVLLDGSIRISPVIVMTDVGPLRISHAILANHGGDVLAAGEGCAGEYLSNTTGHFKNEDFVIGPVKEAFAIIGITFRD